MPSNSLTSLFRSLLLGASFALVAGAGCASDDPSDEDDKVAGEWSAGKGDGSFELVEAGPAPIGEKLSLKLKTQLGAYRVESFGDTELEINVTGARGVDSYVLVEGPLDKFGDETRVGRGAIIAEDDDAGPGRDAKVSIKLAQPGVYRIIPGTQASLGGGRAPTGTVTLQVQCKTNCVRGSIDQKTLVRSLQAQSGGAFTEMANAEIAALIPNQALAKQLGDQLAAILSDPELRGLDRFPTIPLSLVATARPLLGGLNAEAPNPDAAVTGELMQILGACKPERGGPTPIDARLPGLGYGHFSNKALAPCQAAHAPKLAQVLTSLAAGNNSSVKFRGQTVSTPKDLFAALIASGHTIEVRNERMYANFLSMAAGDRDVIWPVWLDTGIKLSNGENFVVPMGHSHHAWRISGPMINARVMFYLGVGGAGFFGQVDQRPAWNGYHASTTSKVSKTSDADYKYLLNTVDTAATYLRRTRIERTTVAAGMPADGYGFVGVCNDSNAVLEYATKGTVTTFPLIRAKQLDAAADLGDGLDAVMRALPKDTDSIGSRDALRRASLSQPHDVNSPHLWDSKLKSQIALAKADLGM